MNKNTKIYGFKSVSLKMDDLDEQKRIVKGYLSAFNVQDSDKDIILPGAFKQSINLRGPQSTGNRKIAFLRMHNWENQIGKFLELYEDQKGLVFVGQLGRSTKGEDALRDYQDGILREHSIGFNYVRDKIDYDEEKDAFYVKEVILWEGSAVTFGSNEYTPVLDVQKALKDKSYEFVFQKINTELSNIIQALKNGKGSDERQESLEMRLRVLQGQWASLISLGAEKHNLSEEDKKDSLDKSKILARIANF